MTDYTDHIVDVFLHVSQKLHFCKGTLVSTIVGTFSLNKDKRLLWTE